MYPRCSLWGDGFFMVNGCVPPWSNPGTGEAGGSPPFKFPTMSVYQVIARNTQRERKENAETVGFRAI